MNQQILFLHIFSSIFHLELHHEFPIHETLPFKLKKTLTDRLQPDTYEYSSLLLLDDVDDDDEDDDGFIDELDEQTKLKFQFYQNGGVTYETVLFTLNTLTVPSEHVEAS